MQTISTVGLDIAESVFQVHSVDATGQMVIRRRRPSRLAMRQSEKG
jgi:transposase